ncbi:MAG: DUF2889 domain-containing protein [Pontibacterium sp.]
MPLPSPAPRTLQHTRRVTCQGYLREDGLWDIEGHLLDTKSHAMALKEKKDGLLEAGEPLHEMAIRITIDLELNILDVHATMDHTPFKMCPDIALSYKHLIGVQIAPGFTRKVRDMFGGVNGCAHLVELLGPIATTAYQATHQTRAEQNNWSDGGEKPSMLDTCHTMDSRGPIVETYWPHFYEGEQNQ